MKPEESSSMSTDTLPSSNSDTEKFESTFIQGFATKFILYEENKHLVAWQPKPRTHAH